jgi:hypothetical protein
MGTIPSRSFIVSLSSTLAFKIERVEEQPVPPEQQPVEVRATVRVETYDLAAEDGLGRANAVGNKIVTVLRGVAGDPLEQVT